MVCLETVRSPAEEDDVWNGVKVQNQTQVENGRLDRADGGAVVHYDSSETNDH